ncbi:hypothetical protein SS50377_20685 [Spironucleus salmonicida]|uniref:Uncharacterized protein n=1 Tax=Spironucleus salmonicida TaxID=348837 RepID=V6M7T1_9EUKA|nr:hypothetical protein SS50377_20685 [Spironucleus salmonicida]|eukprot:EST49534.1 Hypothetical protein SS50377_10138 [Spironucleus salmonicida]
MNSSLSSTLSQSRKQRAIALLQNSTQKQQKINITEPQFHTINLLIPQQYSPGAGLDVESTRHTFKLPKVLDPLLYNGAVTIRQVHTQIAMNYLEQFQLPEELLQNFMKQVLSQIENGAELYPKVVFATPQQVAVKQRILDLQKQKKIDLITSTEVKEFSIQKSQPKQVQEEKYLFSPKINDYQFTERPKPEKKVVVQMDNFQPQINQKSEILAQKRQQNFVQNPTGYSDFQKAKVCKLAEKYNEDYDFKPKITTLAKELEVTEKVVQRQFLMLKEANAKLSAKVKQSKTLTHSFQPQINSKTVEDRVPIELSYLLPRREFAAPSDLPEEEFSYNPKINENAAQLALQKRSRDAQNGQKNKKNQPAANPLQTSTPRPKAEIDAFYENLYQKGVEIQEFRKELADVAESTAVILASSVHTCQRSRELTGVARGAPE